MVTARREGILVPLNAEVKGDKDLPYVAPNADTVILALAIVIQPQ